MSSSVVVLETKPRVSLSRAPFNLALVLWKRLLRRLSVVPSSTVHNLVLFLACMFCFAFADYAENYFFQMPKLVI